MDIAPVGPKHCIYFMVEPFRLNDVTQNKTINFGQWVSLIPSGKTTVKTYTITAREPSIYVTDSPYERCKKKEMEFSLWNR